MTNNENGNEKIMKTALQFLKHTKQYQTHSGLKEDNYKIECILSNGKGVNDVIVYAGDGESVISFNPNDRRITDYGSWGFDFDDDIFGHLERGGDIVEMSFTCHYSLWCTIEERQPQNVENKKGLQKYLSYCDKNKITRDILVKKLSYFGIDAMQFKLPEGDKMSVKKLKKEYER